MRNMPVLASYGKALVATVDRVRARDGADAVMAPSVP